METIVEKPKETKGSNGFKLPEHNAQVNGHSLMYDGTVEILLLIRRNALKLFLIGILVFCSSYYLYNRFYNYYVSSVIFLLDDSDPSEITTSDPERFVLSQLYALSRNRMALLIYSDEMVSRLDQKLNLAEHYHIDRTKPDYKKQLIERLRTKVWIRRDELNTVTISVKDRDVSFPATLANEVYNTVVDLNKEVVMKNIRYKLEIYAHNVDRFKFKKDEDMKIFLQALNRLPDLKSSDYKNPDNMYYLKRDLNGMFNNYESSAGELSKNELLFSLTSDVMKDTSLQAMYLINRAYPNLKKESNLKVSFISFLIAMSVMVYYLLMIYFIRRYKHYLDVLFKKAASVCSLI